MQVDTGREAKERMRERKRDEQKRVKYEQGQVKQKRTEIALASFVSHAQQKLMRPDLSIQRNQVRG